MIRRIRLFTGLVLFAYVATHLINHALGLISYPAMEAGRGWFLAIWRKDAATILLYGSLSIHFLLALWAIYDRRTLKYSLGEALQLGLGIAIPLLLAGHVVGTRGAHQVTGTEDNYAYVLLAHFKFATEYLWLQTAGLIAAWIHGCIGLHYWLRLKSWFERWKLPLFGAAIMLPTLSLLGYLDGGQAVLALFNDAQWWREMRAMIQPPGRADLAGLNATTAYIRWTVIGGVCIALAARIIRYLVRHNASRLRVSYVDGPDISVSPGDTILDISRENDIPHASVCGGRGRCSTCRVRIISGEDNLPVPSTDEQRVLDRINAGSGVRLACQARATGDVTVLRLLAPDASVADGYARPAYLRGEEREIVILFADIRGFTSLSERKLPYDIVFVLNRYFASMGSAIERAGGHLDKFIGDGVMALFGIQSDPEQAAREAMQAAQNMGEALERLNKSLEGEIPEPLRIGIGLHLGPAIIGEMGFGRATSVTAIGDAVNTASRLEASTKEFGAQLVVSDEVAKKAGVEMDAFPKKEIAVRGRVAGVPIRVVEDAQALPL